MAAKRMIYVSHTTPESRVGHGMPLIVNCDDGRSWLARRTVEVMGPSELVFRMRPGFGFPRRFVYLQSRAAFILDGMVSPGMTEIVIGFLPGAIPENNGKNREAATVFDMPTLTVTYGGETVPAHEVRLSGSAVIVHDPTKPRGEKSVVRTSSPVTAITHPIDRIEVEIGAPTTGGPSARQ